MYFPAHRTLVLLVTCFAGLLLSAAPAALAGGITDPVADSLGGAQEQGRNIAIDVRAGAAEIVNVGVGGVVHQGGRQLPLRRATATVAPSSEAELTLRLKHDRHEQLALRALRAGKTLSATITFRFEDLLGNVGKRTKTIQLVS
jgi:hypothetical protein